MVEIAKALSLNARVLILDEPTSALGDQDTAHLLRIMADLRARGTAVVLVTHRLPEVLQIADRVSVMRDGRHVATYATSNVDQARLIGDMVGHEIHDDDRAPAAPLRAEVLRIEHFTVVDRLGQRPVVNDVSLCVHAGGIVGLAGLVGAGRSELLEALFGVHPACTSGRVVLGGQPAVLASPGVAIRLGLALAPEDRKRQGLVLSMTVAENTTLASLRELSRCGFSCCMLSWTSIAVRTSPSVDGFTRTAAGRSAQRR